MMTLLVHLLTALRNDKRGVTALEYGLIASLIAVVIITAVTSIGTNASSAFNTIANAM
jgi:pilus assembly protein Flp/PilA